MHSDTLVLHGSFGLYLSRLYTMYIRVAQFFDTFVLVVKKQHNTRTVWSGIILGLTLLPIVLYSIHRLRKQKNETNHRTIARSYILFVQSNNDIREPNQNRIF